MAKFKVTQNQIQEMRDFFSREKQMVKESDKTDTIKHQLKDYLIMKGGFLNILDELPFDEVKEKNYMSRIENLTSLKDLNTKDPEEFFSFIGVKGNNVVKIEMNNTLTYYKDEIGSIVEVNLTNYGDKDYSNSEYDIVEDPSKIYPSTKILDILKRMLKDYQKNFGAKKMVAEENEEIVFYGSKYR